MDEKKVDVGDEVRAHRGERRPWRRPEFLRLEAGRAEVGINPIRPEGAFADGS